MRVFNFWATLLNDFSNYQNEVGYEKGDDFIPFVTEKDLIDKLNRVPFQSSEAMDKGNAFELAVCTNESEVIFGENKYFFDKELVSKLNAMVSGAAYQKGLKYTLTFDDVMVNFYGYSDFIRRDTIVDLKTTGQYSFPKFDKSFQHKVYLLGANQMGYKLDKFQYLVTDFKDYFYEIYPYDAEKYSNELKSIAVDIINFIQSRKDLITNENLFKADYLDMRII
jgi:hypothetical protein